MSRPRQLPKLNNVKMFASPDARFAAGSHLDTTAVAAGSATPDAAPNSARASASATTGFESCAATGSRQTAADQSASPPSSTCVVPPPPRHERSTEMRRQNKQPNVTQR